MANPTKKHSAIGSGIQTIRDKDGFVTYSCQQHGIHPSRKAARRHYMKEHLGYGAKK